MKKGKKIAFSRRKENAIIKADLIILLLSNLGNSTVSSTAVDPDIIEVPAACPVPVNRDLGPAAPENLALSYHCRYNLSTSLNPLSPIKELSLCVIIAWVMLLSS
jgi:hypothetical protein